jgi:hypothetical protein
MNEPLLSDPTGEEIDPSMVCSTQPSLCPRCQSERIETRGYGKKIGGVIGAAAGIGSGMALVFSGADVNALVGSTADPVVVSSHGLARGVLAVMMSGSAGCTAGAAFGDVLDETVLDKYRCVECGHAFSDFHAST